MLNKDKRFQKTEYLIKKTFFDMVKNNEKITVSNIAKKSNIDRKTFYLHYSSIEDLYKTFTEDAEKLLIEELEALDFEHSKDHVKTFIQAYRKIFIAHKDILYAINNNKNFLDSYNYSFSLIQPYLNINKSQKDIDHETIYNVFAFDGLLKFQQRYIRGEFNLTLDEYFNECEKICKTIASLYAKRKK